ncbi:MAG TPA: hypothetical protein VK525_15830 [Candidatus Saccharimonadales bacterium]|nr:hypothetical protein [Candidatus Saccharimonadales bacterium]
MKKMNLLFCSVALCAAVPFFATAQDSAAQMEEKHKAETKAIAADKSKAEDMARSAVSSIPIKLQVVFVEYEGDKKIKSLPYILYLNAPNDARGWKKLRIGSRVPVLTGKDGGMQYLDVGTNIDARVTRNADARFNLELVLERSWVEGEVFANVEGTATKGTDPSSGPFKQPIIRQFRTDVDLFLRDGQTVESTMATDPLSGKVLRVEITLNVVK